MLTAMTPCSIADATSRPPSPDSASGRGERGKPAAKRRKRVSAASIDWLKRRLADLPASEEDSAEQLDALRGERGSD